MSAILQSLQAFEAHPEVNHAHELQDAGRDEESLRVAESLRRQFPALPGVGILLARIHMNANRWREAEDWSRRAIEMADHVLTALEKEFNAIPVTRHNLVMKTAEYEAAKLSLLRERDMGQFGLVLVLANQGDEAGATALFEQIVAARPDSVFLRVRLAEIYCAMDETESAQRLCRACLDIDHLGALPSEWEDLADLCETLGMEEEHRILATRSGIYGGNAGGDEQSDSELDDVPF